MLLHNKNSNPILTGWYSNFRTVVFCVEYRIFSSCSSLYYKQIFMDAFSSPNLYKKQKSFTYQDDELRSE